jgi:hypothetical protein|uniref:Uncharacterized protein n=1 Tax=Zea mays TaxID=4577 RepID=A0A804QBR9_MAIZE
MIICCRISLSLQQIELLANPIDWFKQNQNAASNENPMIHFLFTGGGGGGSSSNSTESGAGLESPSIQALDLGEGAAVLLVRRRGQVAVGAEGAAGATAAVCIVLQVHAGELVEAAGVDAEAEDEADGHQHQHDERADAARLARAAAHLALSSSVVLAADGREENQGAEKARGFCFWLWVVGWVRSGTGRREGPRSGLVCLGVRARPSGDATTIIKEGGGEPNQVRSYRQIG